LHAARVFWPKAGLSLLLAPIAVLASIARCGGEPVRLIRWPLGRGSGRAGGRDFSDLI
jgi:hypothetical protein